MPKYRLHKEYKPRKRNTLIPQGVSKEEIEVSNMIALEFPGTPIYRSNRQILHGRELDIFLPTKKLAVEFDGLFFHNADSKSKYYHLWKTIECEKQGIQLIHIFSDEWESKKPLVIDLIRKSLGKYNKINSEDCKLIKLTNSEGRSFINNSDVRGDTILSENYIGLLYDNNLVSVLSYKETDEEIFIYRYSERRLVKVTNGLEKLLSYFDQSKPVTAYVDRRLYSGWEFTDAGFKKIESTEPSIWYTQDFKSKIENEYLKLTEAKAKEKGYTAIYDCGSLIFKKIK